MNRGTEGWWSVDGWGDWMLMRREKRNICCWGTVGVEQIDGCVQP